MYISRPLIIAGVLTSYAACANAAEPPAGKTKFIEMCGLCHTAEPGDGLGGMGPSLQGFAGRPAASADTRFPYSPELQASKLVWDGPTLDRFLTEPSKLVPGTLMIVTVPDKSMREDIVAYLQTLKSPPPHP